MGLGLYVAAEAIVFPPRVLAAYCNDPSVIPATVVPALLLIAGLAAAALTIGTDFSFLRGALVPASLLALGPVMTSTLFGFAVEVLFAVAMVGLAARAVP